MDSLGRLYESIQILRSPYLQPNRHISSLLHPRAPIVSTRFPLKLPYTAGYYPKWLMSLTCFVLVANNIWPVSCLMSIHRLRPMNSTGMPVFDGGFVKGLLPYIVTDNLEIKSMSTNQFFTLCLCNWTRGGDCWNGCGRGMPIYIDLFTLHQVNTFIYVWIILKYYQEVEILMLSFLVRVWSCSRHPWNARQF